MMDAGEVCHHLAPTADFTGSTSSQPGMSYTATDCPALRMHGICIHVIVVTDAQLLGFC